MENFPIFHIFFNFTRSGNILYSLYDFENEEINQLITKYNVQIFKKNKEGNTNIYIFGLNESSNASVFFREEGHKLDFDKFVTIINCIDSIYPDFKDDLHLVLLEILFENKKIGEIFNDKEEDILDDIWSKLQYLLNDLNDNFLYALYLYQFYFSKFIIIDDIIKTEPLLNVNTKKAARSREKIRSSDDVNQVISSKSTPNLNIKDNHAKMQLTIEENVKSKLNDFASSMKLPKISFPEIYMNLRFQQYLPKIYSQFHQIYKSIIKCNGAILDKFYVFSCIFFPSIYNNYNDYPKAINNEFKEEDNDDYKNIKKIIIMRVYNDLRNIENDMETICDFFGDFIQINELDDYAIQKDDDVQNINYLIPFSNTESQIETFDQNFNNFPNMAYIIPSKHVIKCAKCKHDLSSIFDNDVSFNEDIFKMYSTGVVDDINPYILHSKLFQYISAFLLSDEQRDNYYFQGNLFILAAKYTFDFFNTDSLEEPILNGLYGIIKGYIRDNKEAELDNPDFLTEIFFEQLANKLIDDGRKILDIQTSNDDYLAFRIRNSVAIAYKFSAKKYLDDNIEEFSKKPLDKDPFENLLTELGEDDENEDDEFDYLEEIKELFDSKGFCYHFFILKLIYDMKMKYNIKPMLSTVYKILNCLDECYVQILANYIYNKDTFQEAIKSFSKMIITK